MQCPECTTENPEGSTFCRHCATRLILVCTQCGTELPLQARFCFHCAAPVGAFPPDSAADRLKRLVPKEFAEQLLSTRGQAGRERRVVTILFSDVKGSTAMAEELDPEEWLEIMDGAFDVLIEPVYRYEGTVARLMGDAILAFFGAPIAHEDDAQRACLAALEIVEGAMAYAALLEEERGIGGFNVRVGINTGLVVVGEVGSDLRVEYTAMGDAVNLAARMEAAAEPGTVLIAEDTHKLAGPLFETESLGLVEVKGKAGPVAVYRVLAARDGPAKPRGIAGLESSLVGREAEFAAMEASIERLRTGAGGIVTVVGEAGIGKSRLVAEIRRGAVTTPLRWVEGRCLSYGLSITYLLWLDALRGVLGVSLDDAPGAVIERLREVVGTLCPDRFDKVYPYLGRMLSLPLEQEIEAGLDDQDGEQLKVGTFGAVETFLACAASDRPLVLVCEDLHWADPSSLELLEHVLPLAGRMPLLLICVFRPERAHGCWQIRETAGRDQGHCHTDLQLDALSAAESGALVSNLLPAEGIPEDLKNRIHGHAEGNPFYLEEILRSLMDEGAIIRDEAIGCWVATRAVSDITIPDTLQGVLMARIDRLQEGTKRVLQVASVIGRVFLRQVLAAIAAAEAAIEERDLDGELLTLQQEEMIRQRLRTPELEYIFKHHLTQEAAYNGLLRRDRRNYHRQVGEVLERLFPERIAELVGLLAHHWERAGDAEKAVAYLLRAGDQARIAYAHEEAVDYYQRALRLLEERNNPERAARLLMKLGLTYHTSYKFQESRGAYERGFALWQRAREAPVTPGNQLPPAPHALRMPHVEFATLDPGRSDSSWGSIVCRELFSTLLEQTRDLDLVPDIARHWEMLDGGRKYVFHLREDVYWSDGIVVTAGDFEYAFKRGLDPAIEGRSDTDALYDIKGARAFHLGEVDDPDQVGLYCPDPWTLVAELEMPAPHLLATLANYAPVPRHAVEALGTGWAEPGNIVTSGPFLLESWRPGESLVLTRNRGYHGRRRGNVERVELCFPKDWSSVADLYETDRIDAMQMESWMMGSPVLDRLRRRYADEYVTVPAPICHFLSFDLARPPFDDARVRQAIVLGTDRETLANVVMRGYNAPATGGFVPPGQPGHSPGIALPYAPEEARHLLAESGYGDGDGFPAVEALTNVEMTSVCQYLQAQWRQNLGIDISWRTMESRDFFASFAALFKNPPHMMMFGLVPSDLDPAGLVLLRAEENGPIWRDEDYGKLVAQIRQATEQKERMNLVQQADLLLIEQAAVMPVMYRRLHWLVKPWVHRVAGWNREILWKDVILDPH